LLRRTLEDQGLFAAERKRRLPRFPRAVGLLTGVDAAARGDVIAAVATRYPAVRLVIAETRVQGPAAPARIVCALAPPADARCRRGARGALVGGARALCVRRRLRRRDPRARRRQFGGSPPVQRRARRPRRRG